MTRLLFRLIPLVLACALPLAHAAGVGIGGGVVVVGGGGNGNGNKNGNTDPNEAAAIASCVAFAEAEEIYHRADYQRCGVLQFAQVLAGRAQDFKRMPAPQLKVDPLNADEQTQVDKLITLLDDDSFAVREKASAELAVLGLKVYEPIRKIAAALPDGEVAQRCKRIIEKIGDDNSGSPVVKLRYQFGLLGSNGGDELSLIDRTLAAAECAAGCDPAQSTPRSGYLFRVLTRQGEAATGGKKDYMSGGMMTTGYALLAFPADYAKAGKKCFMINNNGTVFQRDFGSKEATDAFAKSCIEFNPTPEWKPAQ